MMAEFSRSRKRGGGCLTRRFREEYARFRGYFMKINNNKTISTSPEVAKTPASPSPVPMPSPNLAEASKVSPQNEKQAKLLTQNAKAEQNLTTQQIKLGLTNAKLPKSAAFLNAAPSKFIQALPKQIQKDLSSVGKMLNPSVPQAIQDKFGAVVGSVVQHGGKAIDPNELVQFVLRESYVQTTEDLKYFADKVKSANQMKHSARDELKSLHGKSGVESEIKKWEDKLNDVGDDAQLANVDLQNILQKQQQTLQMMSNISKMLYDTAMAVIRKMGG